MRSPAHRIRRPRTPREELARQIARFRRIRELQSTEGWQKDILPYLQERQAQLGGNALWRPGIGLASCEAIALGCAHNGGRVDELEELLTRLAKWADEGEQAVKEIQKLHQKATGGINP